VGGCKKLSALLVSVCVQAEMKKQKNPRIAIGRMIEFLIMTVPEALIVFARQPDPGNTKTRLSPPLTAESSVAVYACFLADILSVCRRLQGIDLFLSYNPPEAEAYFAGLAPDFHRIPQSGQELGERMSRAFTDLFSQGYRRVVLIGSDLPHLPVQTLQKSFQCLRQGVQVVLGPSADGGYNLIGLTQSLPGVFDLPMSTPLVFSQTMEYMRRLGLTPELLPETFDIDTGVDLIKLKTLLAKEPSIPAEHTRSWLAGWANQLDGHNNSI
jgi:uncharacterized protein